MNKLEYCNDLLEEEKYENVVFKILNLKAAKWVSIEELLIESNYPNIKLKEVYTCWVEPINEELGYKLILFCDSNSMKINSGLYNKRYLFNKKS